MMGFLFTTRHLALLTLAARIVDSSQWDDFNFRRTGNATTGVPAPPPPNPWRVSNFGFDCTPHTPPLYGAPSTLEGGAKLCPFNPSSSVCTQDACYFYRPDPSNRRMCPHPSCDDLITSYCAAENAAGRFDFGCAVLTRPPFYPQSQVGIGPFIDWLESSPIETVTTAKQAASIFVVNGLMRGGMSTTQILLEIQTSALDTNQTAKLREDIASKLAVPTNYIFVTSTVASGSNIQVTAQVVGLSPSEDSLDSLKAATTLDGNTVISLTTKNVIRTNKCFGDNPDELCVEDPAVQVLKTSRQEMSGVISTSVAELEKCPGCTPATNVLTVGILMTLTMIVAFVVFTMGLSSGGHRL